MNDAYSGSGCEVALGDRRGPRRAPANSARGKRNRYRSSKFRNREDSCWEIQLLDVNGVRSLTQLDGHMNTVMHTTVLKALEQRANRFTAKGKMVEAVARAQAWSLDDTDHHKRYTYKLSYWRTQDIFWHVEKAY